jgi:hypothetical protein
MKAIELTGHIDEQRRLHIKLPPDIQPGPVKVMVCPVTEDDEDADWLALINDSWARDWSDPREDICTLEDGEPIPQ